MGFFEMATACVAFLLALSILVNLPPFLLLAAFAAHALGRTKANGTVTNSADNEAALPEVLVQVPTYNEPRVVERVLRAVARLDWPRDRLRVQVLDDSTDDTPSVAADAIAALERDGLQAELRHRSDREGFKAGALQEGLDASSAPFVAILDADYVPAPDWLRASMRPLLRDEGLAFVQSRIDFLNRDSTWFTRGQALLLDIHYVIEQEGRARAGLVLPFNGTCGVWRRTAIDAAGGWAGDTLVEDMDLSYRIAEAGWRADYLLDVSVPGELPESMRDWIGQQKRWVMGTSQVVSRSWRRLIAGGTSLRLRASLLYQFLNVFAGQLSIAALAVGTAYGLFVAGPGAAMTALFAVAVAIMVLRVTLLPVAALAATRRLGVVGILFDIPCSVAIVLVGIAFGALAAVRGLSGRPAIFVRTPKTGAVSGE